MYNLIYNNHRITFGNVNVGIELPHATITYSTVEHGTLTGVDTALIGSMVTVTAIPSTGYSLSYITVNGTQIEGNSFVVTGNTTVGAVFTGIVRSVTTTSSPVAGGSVTASPNSGIIGTEVTLSNTPNTHYHFDSYSLTGATLKNVNQFDIANSDVSVVGNFIEDIKYSVTCTNDGHGMIVASPSSNYSGSTVTLSNTPNSGYTFDKYTLISGTGASISGNTLTIGTSNVTVRGDFVAQDPYNPLNLPPNTVRVRTNDGNPPNNDFATYESATLVAGTMDVYDVYKSGTNFNEMFNGSYNITEVLGANTTGITSMRGMFSACIGLTSVSLFDTSNVTSMSEMFRGCSSLTSIPLFNTSNVVYMSAMFYNCSSLTSIPLFNTSNVVYMSEIFYYCSALTTIPLFNTSNVENISEAFYYCESVQTGALALYQQMSTQTTPPTSHSETFFNCGSNTTTGAAELAQIPSDWK